MNLSNRNGFLLIEIMTALALLGFFGSSIFLVQNNIFSRLLKSHCSVLDLCIVDKYFLDFYQELAQSTNPKSTTIDTQDPKTNIVIKISNHTFDSSSTIIKTFGPDCALACAMLQFENKENYYYSLSSLHKPPTKEKNQKLEKKNENT